MSEIFGAGINDAGYETQKFEKKGTKWRCVWVCPFYRTWKHILERGYCLKLKRKYPTYEHVTVCKEWLRFSTFRLWMSAQDWEGCALDKDILVKGNKEYNPTCCIFIPKALNNFLTNTQRTRVVQLPTGVCWNKDHEKYQARVSNPFTKKRENLGYFPDSNLAHEVWRKRKEELAAIWASRVTDIRLKGVLKNYKF